LSAHPNFLSPFTILVITFDKFFVKGFDFFVRLFFIREIVFCYLFPAPKLPVSCVVSANVEILFDLPVSRPKTAPSFSYININKNKIGFSH